MWCVLNLYNNWAQLLIRRPEKEPVIIHSREGVTKGYPVSMVFYVINLIILAEKLLTVDLAPPKPLYSYDTTFDRSAQWRVQLLILFLEWVAGGGLAILPRYEQVSIHL